MKYEGSRPRAAGHRRCRLGRKVGICAEKWGYRNRIKVSEIVTNAGRVLASFPSSFVVYRKVLPRVPTGVCALVCAHPCGAAPRSATAHHLVPPERALPKRRPRLRHGIRRRARHALPPPAEAHRAAREQQDDEGDEGHPEAWQRKASVFARGEVRLLRAEKNGGMERLADAINGSTK